MFKIGEFSKLTGLSIATLRYYDNAGLLIPEIKSDNGYRYYSKYQLLQSQFINNMKDIDLSLNEIIKLMNNSDPNVILPIISKAKKKLEADLLHISSFEEYYRISVSLSNKELSIDDINIGTLNGGHFLSLTITSKDTIDIFALYGQKLQKKRNDLNLRQLSGMRIIKNAGDEDLDLLIMPVDIPKSEEAIRQTILLPTYSTASCIIQSKTLECASELGLMKGLLNKRGIVIKGNPIIECLLDPGDLMDPDRILFKLHLRI